MNEPVASSVFAMIKASVATAKDADAHMFVNLADIQKSCLSGKSRDVFP